MSSRMEDILKMDISTDLSRFIYFFSSLDFLKTFTLKYVESLLNNEELLKTLKAWDFDAILTDPFDPLGAIVGEFFNIPSIYVQVNHPCDLDFLASQCPSPASYAPQMFTHYSDRMSFWQRTVNMVRSLLQPLACRRLFSHADEIASRFLQRETSMMEIMSRADLWLMLSDFAFEFPRPVMPNMVMIGGLSHNKIHALPQTRIRLRKSEQTSSAQTTCPESTEALLDHLPRLPSNHSSVTHTWTVRGGKIVVMLVDSSHWLSMKILVEELSQKGHKMVVLVPEANYYIRNGSYTTRTV
ncbi:hypothetical protein MHYP_G00062470 [Metynnis hypsauchen]